jgi:hypothetical protein
MRICLGLGGSLEGSRRGFTSSETLVLGRVYASASPFSSSAMSTHGQSCRRECRAPLLEYHPWVEIISGHVSRYVAACGKRHREVE